MKAADPGLLRTAWRRLDLKQRLGWPPINRQTLRGDLAAALTGAVVVVPQGVAFATLAGLPPQYGLYAAMVPAIVAALFGSSWHMVSGPTNAISLVIFATLAPLAVPGSPQFVSLVLCLTFATGALQLALGLARLGTLVNLISHTVVVGFTAGAALLIIGSQLRNFFGIDLPRGAEFLVTLREFGSRITEVNPYVTAVGVATVAAGLLIRRLAPRVPYMVAAILVGALMAAALNRVHGAAHTGIVTIGALPALLPPLSVPDLSLLRQVAPAALALTLLGLTEAVSIGRSIAVKSGQRIDGNREFIGQGLSNIAGSFFSAYASSGSFNRSGLNYESGARTPLAAILSAPLLVALLFLIGPLLAYLPLAAMAGVLFLVGASLIDVGEMRRIARASPPEGAVLAVTLLATLLIHLETAILVGVILSLMLYLGRTTRPPVLDVKPEPALDSYHYTATSGLPDCPQLKMLRINGSIFFGAADHVRQEISMRPEMPQKNLLLVLSAVNFVDVAGAELLAQQARERRAAGGRLYFYRMKASVRQFLERGGYMADIGPENVFPVKQRAIETIYPQLQPDICATCSRRIFRECHGGPPSGSVR
jgi:sulfate permease, SulP family